jgi:hypothetical protein
MPKNGQSGKPMQQKQETLTAGRIIKTRLPTQTDKPNPFLSDLRNPKPQQPSSSGSNQGKPTLTGQANTPKPSDPKKPS